MRIRPVIFAAFAALAVLSSCSRETVGVSVSDAGSPLHLDVSAPGTISTKSSVSGTEGIFSMQLICFDVNGLYSGLGSVSFVPASGGSELSGTLAGYVPSTTASIHFIANAGLIPDDSWKTSTENDLIGSMCSDVNYTNIVYWGYHRESSPESMAQWLDASPMNVIELLRDRAKITVENPDSTWNHSADPAVIETIVDVRFAVCNGRSSGKIAPFDKSSLTFSYDAPLSLPDDASRYTGSSSELVPITEEQFLFEDENSLENYVKVILETTYQQEISGVQTTLVKYHQVMLMDSEFSLYEIRRNHRYNIILRNLPSSIAYDSFEAALAGGPANNQTVVVQDIVPQISSEGYSMAILDGTSHVFQKDAGGGPATAVIGFSFLKDGLADPDTSISDFAAIWLSNKYVSYPNSVMTITDSLGTPGYFQLHVPLYQPISSDLKEGRILLTNQKYGLSRYINIFSITAFDFNASLQASSSPDNSYNLTFTIPDNFPEALLPFKVKLLTEDLTPTSGQNADKALGVEVHETYPAYGVSSNYYYTYEVSAAGTYSISFVAVDPANTHPSIIVDADYFGTLDSEGNMVLDYVLLNL
ncbi:MAG: hypothetical protein J6O51_04705 [Bacteroidales bacterium]|nr:hypothetical protein [Bacteroidales bacterium]